MDMNRGYIPYVCITPSSDKDLVIGEDSRVKRLFFADKESIELLRRWHNVPILDCTYQTNEYNLPKLPQGYFSLLPLSLLRIIIIIIHYNKIIRFLDTRKEEQSAGRVPCYRSDQLTGLTVPMSLAYPSLQETNVFSSTSPFIKPLRGIQYHPHQGVKIHQSLNLILMFL